MGIAEPDASVLKRYCSFKNESDNGTFVQIPYGRCSFLFATTDWADRIICLVLLIISIVLLCVCLFSLVKLLQSLLRGAVKNIIFKVVNADFPGVFRHLTPYLAILVGNVSVLVVVRLS